MSAPLARVEECDACAGTGIVRAERVPSGAELDRGVPMPDARVIDCPVCAGLGARLVAA